VFWGILLVTFQRDLVEEVPALVEKLTGVPVSDQYDTLVTVLVMLLLFYGADYAYRRITANTSSAKIKGMFDGLVADTARLTNKSEDQVRAVLEEKYGKTKIKRLASAAAKFFSPAKHEKSVRVIAGPIEVPYDVVEEIPTVGEIEEIKAEETSTPYPNVEIELHAQDMDKRKAGWAGVVPSVSSERMRMHVYPTIQPEEIYLKQRLRGDVIVMAKKQADGSYKPYLFHLVKLVSAE